MTCKSVWCERPSLEDLAGRLFTAPDRYYCCPECRQEHEREGDGGEMDDADHGYACHAT